MSLLNELSTNRRLHAKCSCCDETFRLSDAKLFDATKPLPPAALQYLTAQKQAVRDLREDLRDRKERAKTRPAIGAQASNIGKVLEKIAPSLPGFPVHAADCRALFEPIDYVVFHGLATRRTIEAITFVDVKSGSGTLTKEQRQIRTIIAAGKVSLKIITKSEDPQCQPS